MRPSREIKEVVKQREKKCFRQADENNDDHANDAEALEGSM